MPSLEYNPFESVKTNINGTNNVIRSTIENNVNKVVLIPTDKAVNPTNLYGVAKWLNFLLRLTTYQEIKNKIFSNKINVLGSRGSIDEILEKNKKI